MKTSFVSFTALSLLLVSGCGVFGEPDSELPVDGTPAPTRPSEAGPAPAPLEGTPVVDELVESFGVFVSTSGQVGADGTRIAPFATISEGIEAAKKTGKRVYVCEGTYREAVTIADGISMVGGLDCSNAKWLLGNARSRIESPSSPAITASSIVQTTRFERFDVSAPDATAAGASSIALFATNASALTIAKSRIASGNGGNGASGVDPQAKLAGLDVNGKLGPLSIPWTSSGSTLSFPIPKEGGEGGKSACGAPPGGAGGTGGVWKMSGGADIVVDWDPYRDDIATYGARAGAAGSGAVQNGSDGTSATTSGAFTRDGFVPANGSRGTSGSPGASGAGGSGHVPLTNPAEGSIWYGVQGAGGGAGGCGGDSGTPGTGGGASIAAFVVDGAFTFVESELVAKNGGAGGAGTFGSAPTPGGKGGAATRGAQGSGGKDGTPGGLAGVSGSGAGGASVVIVHFGDRPKLENTKLTIGHAGSGVAEMKNGGKTIPASASGEAIEILAK